MPDNPLPPPVNIDSFKRISGTSHMPLLKYALPAVMYAAVCAWMLSDESKKPHPDYQTLAITLFILGVILAVVLKRRIWGLADEVLDGGDVGEDLGDPLLHEPLEGLALDGDEVGQLQDLGQAREGQAVAGREARQGHSLESEARAGSTKKGQQ